MKKLLVFAAIVVTFAACSNAGDTTTRNSTTGTSAGATANSTATNPAANTTSTNTAGTSHSATASSSGGGDVPATVRAAITDAQTFTTQHKDIPSSVVASIEKETNTKITDRDHHSYLAFSTATGARRQVGAATVINASGQEMVVVYDSKSGSPVIREVRGAGVPAAFLDQFKGKGHDDALKFGQDIKAQGATDTIAQSVTNSIKADVLAMQALYGSAHSH